MAGDAVKLLKSSRNLVAFDDKIKGKMINSCQSYCGSYPENS